MKRDIIINNWVKMLNVKRLEDFSVEQLACLYDELYLSPMGSASQIFEESNDDERTEFSKALLNCIKNDKQLEIFTISNEGIKDEMTKEYFDFCSRHHFWYQVI